MLICVIFNLLNITKTYYCTLFPLELNTKDTGGRQLTVLIYSILIFPGIFLTGFSAFLT